MFAQDFQARNTIKDNIVYKTRTNLKQISFSQHESLDRSCTFVAWSFAF